jgi:pimeloyl-ACP methyl ester carboxylesterase
VRLELTHRFAIPLRDGFDYIVEPRNWPEYRPGLVRVQPGSRWRAPGDRARVTRLLGRTVELELTLRTFDRYRLIEYTSVQQGLPNVRHERGFSADGDGFEYRLAVEFEPRPGLRGAFDRGLVRRAVKRTMQGTNANLEGRLQRVRALGAQRRTPVRGRRPGREACCDPGAGHVSNLEQPELFNDAVRKFCRAHSPRSA